MPNNRPMLIIEDDIDQRASLVDYFSRNYEIFEASSIAEALQFVSEDTRLDAIILDVGLPDGNGFDLCGQLRQRGLMYPIIMLTGAGSETDEVTGLTSGANDYICKPARYNIIAARLETHLRMFDNSQHAVFNIGPYTFRPASRLLFKNGRKITLTQKEADILKFLYKKKTAVDRATMLDEIWGYNSGVSTHTLETHIYRLRHKIEIDSRAAQILVTDSGGYRLNFDSDVALVA